MYHQIYLTLRNELTAGLYASSPATRPSALPGEMELAKLYGASRVTVRRALKELEQDGLVVKRQGSGTYPVPASGAPARSRSEVDRLYDDLSGLIDGYESRLIKVRPIATPKFVLTRAPDFAAECLHVCIVSWREGQPVHLNNQYISQPFAALIDLERVGAVPLLLLLQRRGVKAHTTDLSISAAAADISSAGHLDVVAGAPLISARRISHTSDGATIEYFEALTRPDLYGYKFRFKTPEK